MNSIYESLTEEEKKLTIKQFAEYFAGKYVLQDGLKRKIIGYWTSDFSNLISYSTLNRISRHTIILEWIPECDSDDDNRKNLCTFTVSCEPSFGGFLKNTACFIEDEEIKISSNPINTISEFANDLKNLNNNAFAEKYAGYIVNHRYENNLLIVGYKIR